MRGAKEIKFTQRLRVLFAVAALATALGCNKPEPCAYCYDNGQIWLVFANGEGARCFNGLGGIQMQFDVPPSCPSPELWRPSKEEVMKELTAMENEDRVGFRPPPHYYREDYWTNVISTRDYKLKHPQH